MSIMAKYDFSAYKPANTTTGDIMNTVGMGAMMSGTP